MHRFFLSTAVITVVLLGISTHCEGEAVRFSADVWPILAERCIRCHGSEKQEGDLRLDTPEGINVGGEFGIVVAAGDPDGSTLVELISLPEDDPDVMPAKGDALSSEEIDLLTRWITEGASLEGWTQSLADQANSDAEVFWAKKKATVVVLPASFTSDVEEIEFNRDIRPILSDNCFKCHGQDAAARKAELRVDDRDIATGTRAGMRVIDPGDARHSELVKRIFHSDTDEIMPPRKSGKLLTETEKHLLASWIEQGAEYEAHWSYIRPERPRVASSKGDDWVRNPIDAFISDRLRSEGLAPSEKADPVTLVRRLYYDLTGLPPAPEVVDAFASNPSDEAYSELVGDLMSSVHYGERMAINWLDQVRYADSNGYHSDEERVVHPYRDYVIKSFNENKRFDEFTVEQLAGDLLDDPTEEQLVATAFNRLNQITAEGGAQSKEYRAKYNADRVRALGSVWMGATLGCNECHEHKFDPYAPQDFYRFAAFFADIEESDVYGGDPYYLPILRLPNDEQLGKLGGLEEEIEYLEATVSVTDPDTFGNAMEWMSKVKKRGAASNKGWLPLTPDSADSQEGGIFEIQSDLSILSVGLDAPQDVHTFTFTTDQKKISGLRFDAYSHPSFEYSLSRHRNLTRLNEVEIFVQSSSAAEPESVKIKRGAFGFTDEHGVLRRTFDGNLVSDWSRSGGEVQERRKPVAWMYEFDEAVESGEDTKLIVRLHYLGIAGNDRSAFGRLRVSATSDRQPEISAKVHLPERIASAKRGKHMLTARDRRGIVNYFTTIEESRDEARAALPEKYGDKRKLESGMAYTMYTKALPVPRDVRFLPRGNWLDDSGPLVGPGIPSFLPPLQTESGRPTRLDLARWLVDERNPLTARVFVNRLWKLYFGTGISAVLDDLGSQGEPPVHPELLDWLAVEFVESGWDVKHIVGLILESSAYRQSSVASAAMLERDPFNRLIARQSRFRYEAEMVRDAALSVSGLLNDAVGGASVRPYQPIGYWENLNFPKRVYKHHDDDRQYRRGLYVHWQRSFLHPSMKAFDAPSREECVAERNMSNTPMQALALLNDPSYVEAAKAFAERIMDEGGDTVEAKVEWAMRQGVLRTPSADEVEILADVYSKHLAEPFVVEEVAVEEVEETATEEEAPKETAAEEQTPEEASPEEDSPKPVSPEVAAWTSVARIILNLHETITRS